MKLIDPLQVQVRKLGDQPPSGMYHLAPFDNDLSTDSMGRGGGGLALRDNWWHSWKCKEFHSKQKVSLQMFPFANDYLSHDPLQMGIC